MTTLYDLEGPLHPPFGPVVVLRTEIQGVRVTATMTSPYMVTTYAVGRRLGLERVSKQVLAAGVVTTHTRDVELVGFQRADTIAPFDRLSVQLDRLAYSCAGKVNSQIKPEDAVQPWTPWDEYSMSRSELYRMRGELFA